MTPSATVYSSKRFPNRVVGQSEIEALAVCARNVHT